MKNLTINISNMQSTHCQARVRIAVNSISGVQIGFQEAGKISVVLDNDNLENKVVEAIEKAGYKVSNNN